MLPIRGARMIRLWTLTFAVLLASLAGPAAAAEQLPTPPGLEANVRFWTRIYTEIDVDGGLIHDAENLDVVYEVVRFPENASTRARERQVEEIKRRYATALLRLASSSRSNLSAEDRRVLSRWPDGTSSATLRAAARRVRFQLGQADRFRAGLVRSGAWYDFIARTLAEHGVPAELAALPHVESSYNPRAYSRVGAAGLWQFTRSTGRLYLHIDEVVDERMDPFKATAAAARLLRDNRVRLGSWPLAITAYNHGAGGMEQAVRKLGTEDLGRIAHEYRGRTFGFASRNFYAEFLAASAIDRDPERWFGPVQLAPPVQHQIIETDHYYAAETLQRALGVDLEVLRENNLALRPAVWNGAKRVPRGYPLRIPAGLLDRPPEVVLASIPASERADAQVRDRFHEVRRGETLSQIARRYGVSVQDLASVNDLRSRHRIRAGQVLWLPGYARASRARVVARAEPPADGIYRVRRGDNLTSIATRFDVSPSDLLSWNRLGDRNRLGVGQRLRVAPPVTVLASASLDAAPAAAGPVTDAGPASDTDQADAADAPDDGPATDIAEEAAETEAAAEADDAAAPDDGSGGLLAQEDERVEVAEVEVEPPPPDPAEDAGASADASAPPAAASSPAAGDAPPPDVSNYAVTDDGRITVQADETLGHYAEWLEVSASRLRRLNRMSPGTPLVIGRQKKLDFSRVTPEVFEQRRLEYHRSLQEEFFSAYSVTGTTTHVMRRGDSLWYLANREYEIPLWLLRLYNPDLDFGSLQAGTPLVIPVVEARQDAL
jgi:membrane-bound lytic murein transglycosylase D